MALVLSSGGQLALLNAKIPYLNGLTLRLFQNDFQPTLESLDTDFQEADFPGYTFVPPSLEFGTPYLNGDGKAESDTITFDFTAKNASKANTIYGFYLTDSAGRWVMAERNPAGGTLISASGDTYLVQLRITDRADPG